jgi:apolipoprotein N-acyltransferase
MNTVATPTHETPGAATETGDGRRLARIALGVALGLASGGLATLAFPPFELWPLIFVAFVPMVIAQHRILPRGLGPLAPGAAIGAYYAGQLSAGLSDGGVAWYIQLWPLYVGLLIAGLCWPGRHFHSRTAYRWLVLSFPIAWVGIDAARALSGVDVLAGTWGNPGYALYAQPWLLQPLTVFGLFGLELLLLMINFAVAGLVIALMDRRGAPRNAPALPLAGALRVAGVVGALAAAWTVMSLVQFQSHPATLRVGTIQANAPRDPEEELARNVAATRALATQGAKLVVWREGMLKFHPLRERTAELKALAAETGAHIALGYGLKQADGLRLNEAVIFAPDGQVFGPYGKSHPGRFAGDQSDTGGDYKVYDTALGKVATIICYDLDFTDTAREMARRGASIIAVPSNDVPAIATTHYTHLVFRAIENRLPMAKADSLFDTAIVDPYGRLLARNVNALSMAQARAVTASRELPAQTLIADVPLASGPTLTTRLGDWIGWLAIAAMLTAAGLQVTRRFRRTGS